MSNDSTRELPTSVKSRDKHDRILDVSVRVFAEKGFRNTDVGRIADLAEVGKGTVYRYFGSKEALFLATSRRCAEETGRYVAAAIGLSRDGEVEPTSAHDPDVDPCEILAITAAAYARYFERHPDAVEIMIQERSEFRDTVVPSHLMYRNAQRERLDRFLLTAARQGRIRDIDVHAVGTAFADLLFGTVVNGCLEGVSGKLVERVEVAVDLFVHGLALGSRE